MINVSLIIKEVCPVSIKVCLMLGNCGHRRGEVFSPA